jgi:hypothetical protein
VSDQPPKKGGTARPRTPAHPARSGRPGADPEGKAALFSAPPAGGAARGSAHPPGPTGKRALFSVPEPNPDGTGAGGPDPEAAVRGQGPVTVECERCHTVSRIGLFQLLVCQFPVGYWLPRPKFDHRMTCPACGQLVWASVTLRPSPTRGISALTNGVMSLGARITRTVAPSRRSEGR